LSMIFDLTLKSKAVFDGALSVIIFSSSFLDIIE
jgi:hypothetical protein